MTRAQSDIGTRRSNMHYVFMKKRDFHQPKLVVANATDENLLGYMSLSFKKNCIFPENAEDLVIATGVKIDVPEGMVAQVINSNPKADWFVRKRWYFAGRHEIILHLEIGDNILPSHTEIALVTLKKEKHCF